MSSWIRPSYPLKKKKTDEYFQTTQAGFCSNFNQLLYAYVHHRKEKIPMNVLDKPNCLSANYRLFKDTFLQPNGIIYIDEPGKNKFHVKKWPIMMSLPHEQIREYTQHLFRLNEKTQTEVDKLKPDVLFDVGIHIRTGDKITTGEMKKIEIEEYVKAVDKLKKDELNIFIMTDNYDTFEKFLSYCKPGWKCWTLCKKEQRGHMQNDFNLMEKDKRFEGFYQFLAELYTMKTIPTLILTYTSNIGRFLYLLGDSTQNIVSLDMKVWAIY